MPYVYNSSQDVEKCTLDLVSSSFTHTNAVQAIAVASKGCWFFLQDPLAVYRKVARFDEIVSPVLVIAVC